MNPFLEWLNSLFKKKEFEMPTPNAFPQYERGPVTAEEVSPEAWNRRLASPLADSLRQMGAFLQPEPKVGDFSANAPMGYVDYTDNWNRGAASGMGFNTNPKAYGRFFNETPQEAKFLSRYRQGPAGNVFDPRRVMIHEYGHIANSTGGEFPQNSKAFQMLENTFGNYLPNEWGESDINITSPAFGSISGPNYKAIATIDPYYTSNTAEAFAQAFVNAFEFLAETARDPKMDYRKFAGDLEANTPGMGLIIRDMLKLPLYKNHPLRGQIFTEKKK